MTTLHIYQHALCIVAMTTLHIYQHALCIVAMTTLHIYQHALCIVAMTTLNIYQHALCIVAIVDNTQVDIPCFPKYLNKQYMAAIVTTSTGQLQLP